jgi:hypothetical protein
MDDTAKHPTPRWLECPTIDINYKRIHKEMIAGTAHSQKRPQIDVASSIS